MSQGSQGIDRFYEYPGSPVSVGTTIFNAPAGALVIDTTNNVLYQKTSALNDNTGYSLVINGVSPGQTIVTPTITSPTLSTITNLDVRSLAADATATSSATLASLTGFSWTLAAAATYQFDIEGKVGMTTNGGLSVAFAYTTLTLASIIVNAFQFTASALALAQSTTTTTATKFIDQAATAYINARLQGSLVTTLGGTLAVQFAQNTSHTDTTTIYKGFRGEFIRTS